MSAGLFRNIILTWNSVLLETQLKFCIPPPTQGPALYSHNAYMRRSEFPFGHFSGGTWMVPYLQPLVLIPLHPYTSDGCCSYCVTPMQPRSLPGNSRVITVKGAALHSCQRGLKTPTLSSPVNQLWGICYKGPRRSQNLQQESAHDKAELVSFLLPLSPPYLLIDAFWNNLLHKTFALESLRQALCLEIHSKQSYWHSP